MKTAPYVLDNVTVTALVFPSYLMLGWISCNTCCRGHLSVNKLVLHGPPLLLHCRPADIHFLSDLFLPSYSVGVVCPCAGRGNVINTSVISYQLAQSFLRKFCRFSKIFFFIVCALTVGYTARHRPHDFRWCCYISSTLLCFQEKRQKYGQNEHRVPTEGSVCVRI